MLLKLVEEIALKEFASRDSAFSRFKKSAVAQAKRINSVEEIKKAVDKVDGYVCEIDNDRSVSIFADNDRGYLFKINVYSENPEGTSYRAEVENWSGKIVGNKVSGLEVGEAGSNVDTCEKAANELVNIVSNNIIKAADLIKSKENTEESLNEGKIKDLFSNAAKSMMSRIGNAISERDTHKGNKDFFKKLLDLLSTKMEANDYTCQAVENKKEADLKSPKYSFYINSKQFKKPLIFRLLFDSSDSGKAGSLKLSSIKDCIGGASNNLSDISVLNILQQLGKKLGVNFVFDSKAARATGSSEDEVEKAAYSTTTGALAGVSPEIAGAVQRAIGESLREDLFLQEAEGSGVIKYDTLTAAYKKASSDEKAKILEYISEKVWGRPWDDLVGSDTATVPPIIKALGNNLNPGTPGTFSYFMKKYSEGDNKSKITGNMANLFNDETDFFGSDYRDHTVLIPAFWNNTDDKQALAYVLHRINNNKAKVSKGLNDGKLKIGGDGEAQLTNIYKIDLKPVDGASLYNQIVYGDQSDKSEMRSLKDIQEIARLLGIGSSSRNSSWGDEPDDPVGSSGAKGGAPRLSTIIKELEAGRFQPKQLANYLSSKVNKIDGNKELTGILKDALEKLQQNKGLR